MFNTKTLLKANQGLDIPNSAAFASENNAFLQRTNATDGDNPKKFTISVFVKKPYVDKTFDFIWGSDTNSNAFTHFGFEDNSPSFRIRNSSSSDLTRRKAERICRDPAEWYHMLFVFDSAQADQEDRDQIYINGERITDWATNGGTELNREPSGTTLLNPQIGRGNANNTLFYYADMYMAEFHFIDGQALTPSDFAEQKSLTGQWVPKKYQGTYGTNGYYLNFQDGSDLGKDVSGNDNHFTNNNVTQSTDTPTNNHPVYFANWFDNGETVTDAGRTISSSFGVRCNIAMPTEGKWYFESELINKAGQVGFIGIIAAVDTSNQVTYQTNGILNGVDGGTSVSGYTTGDIIGVAFNRDDGEVSFYKNGTLVATRVISDNTGFFLPLQKRGGLPGNIKFTYSFPSEDWAYSAPSGYLALSSANLPDPAINIPSNYFNTITYDDGAGAKIVGFQPDLVWLKSRGSAIDHRLIDSVRGATNYISPASTNDENVEATGLTSFDANGFTVGADSNYSDTTGAGMVAWSWAKGTTPSFDVVEYTGDGISGRTVAHSLGVAPELIIVKRVSGGSASWRVYHAYLGATEALILNTTGTANTSASHWNNTEPDASNFTLGNGVNVNADGDTYIAYLWAGVDGYSKFGGYTSNNSADGRFVYTGFTPEFVMIKRADTGTGNWSMYDGERTPINENNDILFANLTNAEDIAAAATIDIVSNGFKSRSNNSNINATGDYVYIAFAKHPYNHTRAR